MYLGFGHVEGSNKWKTVCFGNLGYVNCNVHHVTNLDKSQGKGVPFIKRERRIALLHTYLNKLCLFLALKIFF